VSLKLKDSEGILNYITRVQTVMNQLRRNGESLSEQRMIEKILRLLIDTFENVVCAIEEFKDLNEISVDEPTNSLMAHEQRKKLKKKESLETALHANVVLEKKTLYI
jgi:predicted nucleic acid-binding protein